MAYKWPAPRSSDWNWLLCLSIIQKQLHSSYRGATSNHGTPMSQILTLVMQLFLLCNSTATLVRAFFPVFKSTSATMQLLLFSTSEKPCNRVVWVLYFSQESWCVCLCNSRSGTLPLAYKYVSIFDVYWGYFWFSIHNILSL